MKRLVPVLLALTCAACDGGELLGTIDGAPAAVPPGPTGGAVPAALARHLMIGLAANHGDTWMMDSGVPWDARYRFFVKGWVDNFGYGPADGAWLTQYLDECAAGGFLPVAVYLRMAGDLPGGDTNAELANVQSPSLMATYYREWALFMQRVRDFGKPVVVVVEPTSLAFLEQQSDADPSAPAAVASSGVPEVAGLPDTLAGLGLSYLAIRQAVGAHNAILAPAVEVWAGGTDIAYYNVTGSLAADADRDVAFLRPMGFAPNVTGGTWDLLANASTDNDADYDLLVNMTERRFDDGDAAPIGSRSFNRYAAWLSLVNRGLGRRWLLYQMPAGNSNNLDVPNTGNPREGYKDNHAEYFLGAQGDEHRRLFARAGAAGLLFGGAGGDQASYKNDVYGDGQLFIQSRAGAYLRAGGLPLP
jgi:hypothetical protein